MYACMHVFVCMYVRIYIHIAPVCICVYVYCLYLYLLIYIAPVYMYSLFLFSFLLVNYVRINFYIFLQTKCHILLFIYVCGLSVPNLTCVAVTAVLRANYFFLWLFISVHVEFVSFEYKSMNGKNRNMFL
jgi:hypothetical protein